MNTKQQTLVEYLKTEDPVLLNSLEEPQRDLWPAEVWLAFTEAAFGMEPAYDVTGERLWPLFLLRWLDSLYDFAGTPLNHVPFEVTSRLGIQTGRTSPIECRPIPVFSSSMTAY